MTKKTSIKDELIKSTRAALAEGPTDEQILALIKLDSTINGDAAIVDIKRPEMGTSAGSWEVVAEYDNGSGRRPHELFLRYETLGETIFKYTSITHQFHIMKALGDTYVPVPEMLSLDADGSALGTPGFIMGRLEGKVPSDFYEKGLMGKVSAESRREMVLNVARVQAQLHSQNWQALGVDFLKPSDNKSPVEAEITRVWNEISWAAPEILEDAEPAYHWLIDNLPGEIETVLCHGDANLTNYMFKDNQVVGVLDWEFAFLGPREFDLAYFMAVTDTLTIGQTAPDGYPRPDEFKAEYERASGVQLRNWEYACKRAYFTVACNLWMGLRFIPQEGRAQHRVLTDHCLDRVFGKAPIEI